MGSICNASYRWLPNLAQKIIIQKESRSTLAMKLLTWESGIGVVKEIIVCWSPQWPVSYSCVDKFKSHALPNCLACHTLTKINEELAGDPLDLKLLQFTHFELHEPMASEKTKFDRFFPSIVRSTDEKRDRRPITSESENSESVLPNVSDLIHKLLFYC